jgi:hypothetical protein
MDEEDGDPIETLRVDEFDRGTKIYIYAGGRMQLKLACMPPSWADRSDPLDDFQDVIARGVGAAVEGLDKEFFAIVGAPADGAARLRACLLELRRSYPRAASPR